MPPSPKEKVDHVAEARQMVSVVIDGPQDPRNPGAEAYLIGAQVHASIALAEQLQRLNETLGGAEIGGQFGNFLDRLCEGIQNIVWHNTGGGK